MDKGIRCKYNTMTKLDTIPESCLTYIFRAILRRILIQGSDELIAFVQDEDDSTWVNVVQTVLPAISQIESHHVPVSETVHIPMANGKEVYLNISISHNYGVVHGDIIPSFHIALAVDGEIMGWAVAVVVMSEEVGYNAWRYNKIILGE